MYKITRTVWIVCLILLTSCTFPHVKRAVPWDKAIEYTLVELNKSNSDYILTDIIVDTHESQQEQTSFDYSFHFENSTGHTIVFNYDAHTSQLTQKYTSAGLGVTREGRQHAQRVLPFLIIEPQQIVKNTYSYSLDFMSRYPDAHLFGAALQLWNEKLAQPYNKQAVWIVKYIAIDANRQLTLFVDPETGTILNQEVTIFSK